MCIRDRLHKRWEGEDYLIAANEGKQTREATVQIAVAKDLHVAFENRTVAVRDGAFADRFGPYEVHVYATAAQLPSPLVPAPRLEAVPPGESLQDMVRAQRELAAYAGKADWIWYPGTSRTPDAVCYLRRTFTVPGAVKSADLIITADDEYVLYLNGQEVPVAAVGWSRAEKFSIAPELRQGLNVIAVKAKDAGAPPCGFLMDATIATADGKTVALVSDGDWVVSDREQPGWEQPGFNPDAWRKAEVVAPYGGGAWGTRLLVHEVKQK